MKEGDRGDGDWRLELMENLRDFDHRKEMCQVVNQDGAVEGDRVLGKRRG